MRILQLVHSLRRGGAERVLLDLANGLIERGHTVKIVALLAINEYQESCYAAIPHQYLIPPEQYRWPWSVPMMARALGEVVNKFHPDLIEIHTPTAAVVTACAKPNAPVVHVLHGYDLNRGQRWIKDWLLHKLYSWAYQKLKARLVVVSVSMVEEIGRYFSCSSKDIRCIWNGVDLKRFLFFQRELPINPVIVTLGTLAPVKRPDLAIYAMGELVRRFPGAKLLMVGDGPLHAELLGLVKQLNLEQHIEFLGRRERVPEILAMGHIFWQLSMKEGCPVAIIEAMATGLPVVGHDVAGIQDIVKDGFTGFLIPYENIREVSQKTTQILTNSELYYSMSLRARQHVEREFSLERMVTQHEAVMQDVIREAR